MTLAALFRDMPIRRKLTAIAVLSAGAALIVVAVVSMVSQWFQVREELVKTTTSQATIVAANSASALIFNDPKAATRTLAALRVQDDIEFAELHDRQGKRFALYMATGQKPPQPHRPPEDERYSFSATSLDVFLPIIFEGERVGSIHMRSSLDPVYRQMMWSAVLVVVAASAGLGVALILISYVHPAITDPMTRLVGLMDEVSRGKDYGVRAEFQGKDELGALARGLNDMLAQIQLRDSALEQHRRHLEDEVAQRTTALTEANRLLEQELLERKRVEEKIRESEERYRGIFEYADDIIYLLGPDGSFWSLNPAFERLTGWQPDEWIGKPFAPIIHPDDLPRALDVFRNTLAGQSTPAFELRIARKTGEYFDSELSIAPVTTGGEVAAIGIARDVTERKQMGERIRRQNEELEAKVRERTQQLVAAQEDLVRKEKLAVLGQVAGSVGHELRNPLGVMSNAVYFLQTVLSEADATTKEYLGIIQDEIAGAERIVADLLDSVRIKPPQPETVGVNELIAQTLRKCTVPAGVSIQVEIPETLPPLRVDARQIHQVLRNLICNGIDAMSAGGTLEIRARADAQAGTVTVAVRDSGCGMTSEQLAKLFQPLFTTKARGIGLGLVVVKNLTQANGGSVAVESEPGKGTVFTITLPAADEWREAHA